MQDLFSAIEYATGTVAGVDEVGRGPLCGDVVTAAVILDPNKPIDGLADSKKLTDKRRDALYDEIIEKALCWSVARASVSEIDELNILHATMLAMKRAVDGLATVPAHVFVDGNRLPKWHYSSEAIVKGDSKVAEISAASILAKVTRDREMIALGQQYPDYGFASHKGYPSKAHLQALHTHGLIDGIYRTSYAPIKKLMQEAT